MRRYELHYLRHPPDAVVPKTPWYSLSYYSPEPYPFQFPDHAFLRVLFLVLRLRYIMVDVMFTDLFHKLCVLTCLFLGAVRC